jgi:hypothetical protein
MRRIELGGGCADIGEPSNARARKRGHCTQGRDSAQAMVASISNDVGAAGQHCGKEGARELCRGARGAVPKTLAVPGGGHPTCRPRARQGHGATTGVHQAHPVRCGFREQQRGVGDGGEAIGPKKERVAGAPVCNARTHAINGRAAPASHSGDKAEGGVHSPYSVVVRVGHVERGGIRAHRNAVGQCEPRHPRVAIPRARHAHKGSVGRIHCQAGVGQGKYPIVVAVHKKKCTTGGQRNARGHAHAARDVVVVAGHCSCGNHGLAELPIVGAHHVQVSIGCQDHGAAH